MLICQNQPYVEYSKTPRLVNLKGSTMVKSKIPLNDDPILTTKSNWQEAYWQRDSCPAYQQLCKDYPHKFKYHKPPKDISLRDFVTDFTINWQYKPSNAFPHFIPTYKYVVHKGKPHYEEFCKNMLLMDKPGCYFQTVGKSFSSCEAELKDFVENSELCPDLLKKEFTESQKVVSDSTTKKSVQGDAFDELYLWLDRDPEYTPKEP